MYEYFLPDRDGDTYQFVEEVKNHAETQVSLPQGFGVVTFTSSFITFGAAGDDSDTKMEGTTCFLRTRLVL